jgi:hypothetical protein
VDSRVKNLYADGTITASNLNIVGDYVTMRTTTSNTEMMVIENAGTGPALKVTQTGVNSIAEFYDDGGVLALKIADGGNVGIGTVNPQAKLHVIGSALMENVGIGITPNTFKLNVLGSANIDGTCYMTGDCVIGANTTVNQHTIQGSVGFTYVGTQTALIVNQKGTGKIFEVQDFSAPVLTVLDGGNVGIGTALPLAKLTVFGSGQASLATFNTSTLGGSLHICDSTSQVHNGGAVVFGTYQGNFAAIKSSIIDGTTNTVGHLSFYTRNTITDSSLTNRMTILNTGNVGIGTTNPQATLDINGNIRTSTNSTNYSIGTGVQITIGSATATTVSSVNITTRGKPVLVMCSGDLQPVNGINDWCYIELFRGATAIGNRQIYHPGTAGSTNQSFCIHAIDVVGAGTYTYALKAYQGVGNIQFGEIGVPYITAIEFV